MCAARHAFALLLLATLAACGGEDGTASPGEPADPPNWRASLRETNAEEPVAVVRFPSPGRLLLIAEGFEGAGSRSTLADSPMAAGRSVRLSWTLRLDATPSAHPASAPEEAAAEGRTSGYQVVLAATVDGRPTRAAVRVVWTRPERGQSLEQLALPPARAADLPLGTDVELAAAAVVDSRSASGATLRRAEGRSRVRIQEPHPDDRQHVVRLLLRAEPR